MWNYTLLYIIIDSKNIVENTDSYWENKNKKTFKKFSVAGYLISYRLPTGSFTNSIIARLE